MRGESNCDGWLVAAGLVYPAVAFGVLLGNGGGMGPLAFRPLAIPLSAVLLGASAIGLRASGARFRRGSVALFVAWLCAVACAQWLVYAEAAAAV